MVLREVDPGRSPLPCWVCACREPRICASIAEEGFCWPYFDPHLLLLLLLLLRELHDLQILPSPLQILSSCSRLPPFFRRLPPLLQMLREEAWLPTALQLASSPSCCALPTPGPLLTTTERA